MDPGLQAERQASPFSVNEVAAWWLGDEGLLDAKQRIDAALKQDKDFLALGPTDDIYRLSRHERYVRVNQRFLLARKKLHAGEVFKEPYGLTSAKQVEQFYSMAIGPDGPTIGIHFLMFLSTLRTQASEEQQKLWLKPAENLAIFGCYAQSGEFFFFKGLKQKPKESCMDGKTQL